ncbi:MAG: hypothetical protein M0Q26_03120 [Chitinophagaceae bacterium]|nr:hypothetical protein [Chitinophagaceae bacterium]MDP1812699.1 hypothetical protein [Sediminibacterium sp.]MDP3127586.1 hypothetical protein [Sediminibacterium sp.]MDP3665440.1 hypothetical protein [Sediminibacterium sp.]
MYKSITILYLVCFGAYMVMTRQPDYFDGEKAPAVIKWLPDSAAGTAIPKAVFNNGYKDYAIDARYFLRNWKKNEKTEVIYETDHPEMGAVYTFWGYWLTWSELLATVLIYVALFQIAISVTKNPTAEALVEQLEYKEEKKRKYLE